MPVKIKLKKFVDELPIPNTLSPKKRDYHSSYYEVTMKEFSQKLHRDLGPTRLWGYEGMFPGPTFEVMKNETVFVKWMNDLPKKHFLPVDTTIHGSEITLPEGRSVVHLHGGRTPAHSDGYPEAWFTRNFEQTGPLFEREVYTYPNMERATMLWYHDHTVGITRLNIYAGLAGLYFIRDEHERSLNLPKGNYEIPLLIVDRSFNSDGSLYYPSKPDQTDAALPHPSLVSPFDADTILVNGKVYPYLDVEPRKYRFRILNASNSRILTLRMESNQPFYQIGTDGGFLETTVKINEFILMSAERVDVIIDFSQYYGQTMILKNVTKSASPETADVMQFRVTVPLRSTDTSSLPFYLGNMERLPRTIAKKTRYLTLVRIKDQYGRSLNLLGGKMWMDRISEKIEVDTVEIWRIINLIDDDPHPIHLHLVDFQILDRQPFDVSHFQKTGSLIFTGPPAPPNPYETGLKDTVGTPFGYVTSIIARFGPFTGRYVWHCHMLEHEDHEMMRPIEIFKAYR
ncbi:multicopper oxidase family protein [Paenibacillus allorhizosphaerae]|uniref:Spore coat protein A n=1 Tax=Paenibacillus allorhizosphaerae TaxID=2849866 RepID=A0ABM8VR33_9BACL|nr:multicopper oxidase [Paenibacillus allorhizosphaerae]CAG7654930.1 Spore coat protein A [Paenibacillus allorhizosphaerae]